MTTKIITLKMTIKIDGKLHLIIIFQGYLIDNRMKTIIFYVQIYILQMDFKITFDQYDQDQMINMSQQAKTTSKSQSASSNDHPPPQPPNQQQFVIKMNQRQQGIIQHQYDGQQTIFINKQSSPPEASTYQQPSFLEDVGVDPQLIAEKILAILKFQKPIYRFIQQTDLSGPLIIAFLFGFMLLLSGKMHFGDIYALFIVGNLLIFILFNLMSKLILPLYNVMSTLGYCLLPMLIVGFLGIIVPLQNTFGIILSLSLSAWSAYSASNYLQLMMDLPSNDRKALILYPLYLYYVSFAMITIF